jgi:hypothetical protein
VECGVRSWRDTRQQQQDAWCTGRVWHKQYISATRQYIRQYIRQYNRPYRSACTARSAWRNACTARQYRFSLAQQS